MIARAALVALVLGVAGQSALASPQEKTQKKPASEVTFDIQKRTYNFKEAGKDMEYALFVPSKYDKAKKWPPEALARYQVLRFRGSTAMSATRPGLRVGPKDLSRSSRTSSEFSRTVPSPRERVELTVESPTSEPSPHKRLL